MKGGDKGMLVLSLNPMEAVRLTLPDGSSIRVILVRNFRDTVQARIGFEADRSIKIVREELDDKGNEDKQSSG